MQIDSQEIFESLIGNGVYFCEIDIDDQIVRMGDDLSGLLSFKSSVITFQQLVLRMPDDFRSVAEEKVKTFTEWLFPLCLSDGIRWVDVHKLQTIKNEAGHEVYLCSARFMSDDEVSNRVVDSGVAADTLTPLMGSLPLMAEKETFYEGVNQLLSAMRKQVVGTRGGLLKWNGVDELTVIDYVGGRLIDQNGRTVTRSHPLVSPWVKWICEKGEAIVLDKENRLPETMDAEKRFFTRNGIVSAVIAPVVVEGGQVWGLLGVLSPTRSTWSAFDKKWVEMMSRLIAICINRQILVERVKDQFTLKSQACSTAKMMTWAWDIKSNTGINSKYTEHGEVMTPYTWRDQLAVLHKSDHVKYSRLLADVQSGKLMEFDVRVRMADYIGGEIGWREVIGQVISFDAKGKPEKIVGVVRDIDDEVRTEQQEKAVAEFQNSVYNNLPAAIEFFNADGDLTYMNDKGVEMFGMLGGHRAWNGLNIFANPNLTDSQIEEMREKEEVSFSFQYDFSKVVYKTSKKDLMPVVYRMSKMYVKGKLTGFMVVVVDNSKTISQERQIDIFQRYVLEVGKFAKMGICWFTDTKNGYVSEQWNINLGIDPYQPFVRNLDPCVHVVDEDLEVYGSLLSRIFVGDIESFQHEIRVHHTDDGMLHYIKVQFVRSQDAIIGISLDVTQSKENEKMLVSAKRKAEKADMLKSQFLSNMSHEIRTPLNAIVGFSELIAESIESIETKIYSDLVRANNDLLLGIITDILDLSKLESGTFEMSYGFTNLNGILHDVYEIYNAKPHSKIEFDLTPCDVDVVNYCDAKRITQVLGNFVSNAFKFTASGKVELSAKLEAMDIVISVRDTGSGIPASQLEKIFEPFVKLDLFSIGTGLGLSICRRLAHEMSGRIEVVSHEGEGSVFKLIIPYIAHVDEDKLRNKRNEADIMLLCNNGETIQFVSYALDGYDLVVEQEHVFMTLWLEKKPTLTIIDQQLFGDSTALVVSSLKNYGEDKKVIVMCPTGVEVNIEAITKAGASAVMNMPIKSESFSDMVDRVIDGKVKRKKHN